uniref:Uncharacterized protein n=1 Tax=Oryza punctata TaxID=4537 RepID=A0A0E0K1D9_ORYPU
MVYGIHGVASASRQLELKKGEVVKRGMDGDGGAVNALESTCSWGQGDSGHRRNGMYYGTPFYGGYGYASPLPHPNMYAAAYGAYPYYGNQQLVS